MAKKATKLKVAVPASRRSAKVGPSPLPSPTNGESQFAQGVLGEAQEAASSEDEALSILISRITDKLGEQGMDGAQMREFLSLILDTDPTLKEEILQGITPRK